MKKFADYYLTFCVYALIGWLYEVLWMWFVVPPKHFINRGVLYGPFLPIYGFGALILLLFLHKFMKKKHTLNNNVYFFISIITLTTFIYTTIIEYTTPKIYNILYYLQNYGIGLLISNIVVLTVIYLLKTKFKKVRNIDVTIILVFLAIWIITTLIEYVSHFVMDKCFNIMLWDYTKDFLNINKRVNWDASRNFAIGGTFFLYTIQPLLDKVLPKTQEKTKIIISLVIGVPMILDFIFHVILKVI